MNIQKYLNGCDGYLIVYQSMKWVSRSMSNYVVCDRNVLQHDSLQAQVVSNSKEKYSNTFKPQNY